METKQKHTPEKPDFMAMAISAMNVKRGVYSMQVKEMLNELGEKVWNEFVVPTSAERDRLKEENEDLKARIEALIENHGLTHAKIKTIAAETTANELQAINSELLEALKDNYLRLQIIANSDMLFAATTDSLRASMRNKISKLTGQSSQTIQEENESQAIAKATKP